MCIGPHDTDLKDGCHGYAAHASPKDVVVDLVAGEESGVVLSLRGRVELTLHSLTSEGVEVQMQSAANRYHKAEIDQVGLRYPVEFKCRPALGGTKNGPTSDG